MAATISRGLSIFCAGPRRNPRTFSLQHSFRLRTRPTGPTAGECSHALLDQKDRSCGRSRSRVGDGGRLDPHAGRGSISRWRLSWRGLSRRLGRRWLAWWWLGPARLGRGVGLSARGLGLGRWLGRRLLELRVGLGLGSGLGDCGGDRARRGGDRFAAGLRRRTRLLGPAARLDRQRPLYGPPVGQHLHVNINGAAGSLAWPPPHCR
jgi:hypothetical protein